MSWLSQSVAYHDLTYVLGWVLLHSVWQAAAAAGVLMIMLRLASHGSAAARYMLSLAMLLSVVAAGVITGIVVRPEPRVEALVGIRGIDAPSAVVLIPQDELLPARTVRIADAPVARSWNEDQILRSVVLVWLAGVIGLSFWQLGGWLMLRHHRRTAAPADPLLQASLARLASMMKIGRSVGIAMSARLEIPLVIGVIRPIILVPISMLSELSPKQVEAILAHELAHVGRHDYLVNLIQCAIETLLFYHPAIWWISKQVRAEREFCCDELAAKACGDAADYGRALLALEECRGASRLAPSASGTGDLLQRVRRLMGTGNAKRTTRARSWAIAATVLVACLMTLASVRKSTAQATKQAANPSPTSQATGFQDAAYQIKNGDLVKVSILGLVQADVVSEIEKRVSDNGMINLPLVGDLQAAGLTCVQLEVAVVTIYRDRQIIQDPRPSVKVIAPALTTRPTVDAIPRSAITPEDLVFDRTAYRIGPDDVLKLLVVGLPEPERPLAMPKRVSQTGTITLPMAGDISVIGLTTSQLEKMINSVYREKQLPADATVSLIDARNQSFVISEVGAGGVYSYEVGNRETRLLEAIASARINPAGSKITVVRKAADAQSPRILEISGDRLVSGDNVNIIIRPGDYISVQKPSKDAGPAATSQPRSDREALRDDAIASQIRLVAERLMLAKANSIEAGATYAPEHQTVLKAHSAEEDLSTLLDDLLQQARVRKLHSMPDLVLQQEVRTLSKRLAEAKIELIDATASRPETHPTVIRARRIEKAISDQLEQLMSTAKPSDAQQENTRLGYIPDINSTDPIDLLLIDQMQRRLKQNGPGENGVTTQPTTNAIDDFQFALLERAQAIARNSSSTLQPTGVTPPAFATSSQRSNFLATQVESIRSSNVLGQLLTKPEIVGLETFKLAQGDVLRYLRENLDVTLDRKTDVISISVKTPYPADGPKIVTAIGEVLMSHDGAVKILERGGSGTLKVYVEPPAAAQRRLQPFRVVVDASGVSSDGRASSWALIRESLHRVPATERRQQYIELVAGADSVSVKDFFAAQAEAQKLVTDLGLAYVSTAGIAAPGTATQPAAVPQIRN